MDREPPRGSPDLDSAARGTRYGAGWRSAASSRDEHVRGQPCNLATLPEVAARYPEAVVLWIDAHGDFNTPKTTGSGYLGGMVLSAACGLWDSGHRAGLDPHHVALVGARDIDPDERALLKEAGVSVLPPS